MNLIQGKLLDKEQSLKELDKIYETILTIKQQKKLHHDVVISACNKMAETLNEEEFLPVLLSLGIPKYKAKRELVLVKQMLSKEYLEKRLDIELGIKEISEYTPIDVEFKVNHMLKPLGVLLHIVAGNVDALPTFSVIEGLLTGNINIVKLPGADNGLSIRFLNRLIKIEPQLTDYIFAFDYPSKEVDSIKKMANVSDAIIIWGGDNAVSSVREMASPNTRIIEWGHKVSFSYVSGNVSDTQLEGIAYNICDTNQLFCSSCQGIYLDTDKYDDVIKFADRFIKILDKKAVELDRNADEFLRAQKTLEFYTEKLESIKEKKYVLKTDNCGVIAYDNSQLIPSYMFRHCWIKPLPKNKILSELLKYKNHLQTVALLCEKKDKDEFVSLFSKTGIVRISKGDNMSLNYCGMPHDGEFSLAKYMKIVSVDC